MARTGRRYKDLLEEEDTHNAEAVVHDLHYHHPEQFGQPIPFDVDRDIIITPIAEGGYLATIQLHKREIPRRVRRHITKKKTERKLRSQTDKTLTTRKTTYAAATGRYNLRPRRT
jgi:hypothetical protein